MDKIKNLPVMRFVAFAVALAIILGLSSVILSFTASAEDVVLSDLPVGTIGNYKALRFPISSDVQYVPLSQITAQSGNSSNVAIVGKCNSGYKVFCIFSIVADSNNCTLNGNHFLNDGLFRGSSANFDNFALQIWSSQSNGYRNLFYQLSYKLDGADHYSVYVGWNGSVSDKFTFTDYYFIFGSYSNDSSDFVNDIENNISSDTDFKDYTPPPTGGSENGRFICFGNYKEYPYDTHLTDISTGSIYQRIDYLASEQSKYTAFMFDDKSCFDWADNRVNDGYINMYSSTSIAFNYYNSSDSVGAVKLRVSKTQMFPSMRQSDNPFDVSHYFVMKPANKHFSRYVIIEDGSLRSVPVKSTATFRVNMQGYCNMDWNSYYLLEIVDVQTDTVISSTMFVYTGKNSGKIDGSNIKNGSFISVDYQYEDGNKVNNGILTPDSDGTLPNLPNGIKDDTYNPSGNYNLSNLDISDIFSSLNQATASVGAFFQATLNIIPITIMTLILGSLALLIVLRVLGR